MDIVAQKADLVIVVEVRARGATSFEKPLASLSRSKRLALLRATRALWKGRFAKRKDIARIRIDVIAVTDDGLEWIKGAITEQDA